jgi:hypothetical protein
LKKSVPVLVVLLVSSFIMVVPFGAAIAQTSLSSGTWSINANGFKGTLKITSVDDRGHISGTVQFFNERVNSIDGQYHNSHVLTFTRHQSATASQFYTGVYDDTTHRMKGFFKQSDTTGRYQWTAMPVQVSMSSEGISPSPAAS